jgi:radical SAM superfamily enzyme YgiQ (UPF0313 family)
MASFTLGHDGDDASSGDLIMEFCERARLNLVEFTIYTPFPGTPLFRTMEREGRLLTREWGKYNAANVVFQPKSFTPEQLKAFYLEMWRRFYKDISPFEIRKRYVKAFTGSILFPSQE